MATPKGTANSECPRPPGMPARPAMPGVATLMTWDGHAKRLTSARLRNRRHQHNRDKNPQERGAMEPRAKTEGQDPESLEGRQGANKPNLPGAAFSDFQGDAGVEFLIDNLGEDKVAFSRERFTERAQNGQRVSMRSPAGAPDDQCVCVFFLKNESYSNMCGSCVCFKKKNLQSTWQIRQIYWTQEE